MVSPPRGGSSSNSPSRGRGSGSGNLGSKAPPKSLTLEDIRRGLQRSKEANASRESAPHGRSQTTPTNPWDAESSCPHDSEAEKGSAKASSCHRGGQDPPSPKGGIKHRELTEGGLRATADSTSLPPTESPSTTDSVGGSCQQSAATTIAECSTSASGSADIATVRVAAGKLAQICQESLVYIDVLDGSRSRLQAENNRLRSQIREFEGLLDDSRERERQHLETAQSHRDGLSKFETKYKHIKEKAKATIQDCQAERDKFKRDQEDLRKKTEALEGELNTIQPQLSEMERLRDASKSVHELQEKVRKQDAEMVDLHLKVRRLENDNGQLATERTRLQQQVDELQGPFRAQGSRRSILGSEDLFDRSETTPRGTNSGGDVEKKLHEKGLIIRELQAVKGAQDDELVKLREDVEHYQSESLQYQQYCEALLQKVDQMENPAD